MLRVGVRVRVRDRVRVITMVIGPLPMRSRRDPIMSLGESATRQA